MGTVTVSALTDATKAAMRARLAQLAPGEHIAADDVTAELLAAGADRWERGEVWRWATAQGLVEPLSLDVMGTRYFAFRPSRDPAARARRLAVYIRTSRPALRAD